MPGMSYAIIERLTPQTQASECVPRRCCFTLVFPGPAPARGTVVTEILLCQVLCVEAADPLMYWSDGNVPKSNKLPASDSCKHK